MRSPALNTQRGKKQLAATRALRGQIVEGVLGPGTRLPTRLEWEQRLGVSWLTIQAAFDRLRTEGFIDSRGAQGTFVAERPPHLFHYGLVFSMSDSESGARMESKFHSALMMQCDRFARSNDRRLVPLFGAKGRSDSAEFRRLLEVIDDRRVSGLIYARKPHAEWNVPLPSQTKLPSVVIGLDRTHEIPSVAMDFNNFTDRALDALVRQGCRRVGQFHYQVDTSHPIELSYFEEAAARRDLHTESYWNQPCAVGNYEQARYVAHLLGRLPPNDRPDGLIIRDDNMEEHVLAGLLAAGLNIGRDIKIVTHTNFPTAKSSIAKVLRLGFDVSAVVDTAVDLIDRQRQGQPIAQSTIIQALFEDELSISSPA